MSDIVTLQAGCEAKGHPTQCSEPALGTVQEQSSGSASSVTVTNEFGNTGSVASIDTADMHFDSHSHDYTDADGCHNNQSHDIDPDVANVSSSLTINGSPVYVVGNGVTTDPVSGGDVDITDAGANQSVSEG